MLRFGAAGQGVIANMYYPEDFGWLLVVLASEVLTNCVPYILVTALLAAYSGTHTGLTDLPCLSMSTSF